MTGDWEWAFLNFLQTYLRTPFLDGTMRVLTSLGNSGAVWILAALSLLCCKKYRRAGLSLAFALIFGFVFGNLILKELVARERPASIAQEIVLLITRPNDYSFPSGHTLSSMSSATVLTMTDRRFGAIAFPLAILISFSRMYLYVHFPTDIIAGAVLGGLIGFLCAHFLLRRGEAYMLPLNALR